jgi:hypothetical protein
MRARVLAAGSGDAAFPEIEEVTAFENCSTPSLHRPRLETEVAYLERETIELLERPYWLGVVVVDAGVSSVDTTEKARKWSLALNQLADVFADSFWRFCRGNLSVRVGTHFNSAFAIHWRLEYPDVFGHDATEQRC